MSATWFWNQRPLDLAKIRWQRIALTAASQHLRKAVRTRINVQGHPGRRRSLPGEAPRYESKDLLKSWIYDVHAAQGYADVGSPLGYSWVLEVGGHATFGYIAPRPYVRVTLVAEEAVLAHLLTPPLP